MVHDIIAYMYTCQKLARCSQPCTTQGADTPFTLFIFPCGWRICKTHTLKQENKKEQDTTLNTGNNVINKS